MRIAVIGGGAAGMMATAHLLEQSDHQIHLFEKNKQLGAKVIISGGGRCNLTTAFYRRKDLADKYVRGSDFVREAIGFFGPRKIFQRFENHGVPLKIEEDHRVFPQSNNGKDIVGVFERIFTIYRSRCALHLGVSVQSLQYQDGKFILQTAREKLYFDKVIIATGGNAYAHTGSTGDAYTWLRDLGHTITPLGPSLNSFLSTDRWMHQLSGLSFHDAKLSCTLSHNLKKEAIGPVLLTHFGLSGPIAFVISAYTSFETIDRTHPLMISFQPYANMGKQERNDFLIEQSSLNPRKKIATILHQYFTERCLEELDQSIFHGQLQQTIGLCTKQFRLQIVDFFSGGWTITVVGRRAGDEFVTAGGALLSEFDPKTLESRIIPGLYCIGEVLDIDAVTGGYNLTSSWATGALCAKNIAVLS